MNQINIQIEREQWSLMKDQAITLIKSKALPSNIVNAEQALAIIQYGRELGYSPMTSLQNIVLINGKPALSANLIGGTLKRAGYKFKVKKYEDDEVIIEFTDLDGDKDTFSYTMVEAKQAGNTSKANYSKYTKEMLYARCLTRGGRIVAPEVLAGVYAPEEFDTEEDNKNSNITTPEAPRIVANVQVDSKDIPVEIESKIEDKPQVEEGEIVEPKKDQQKLSPGDYKKLPWLSDEQFAAMKEAIKQGRGEDVRKKMKNYRMKNMFKEDLYKLLGTPVSTSNAKSVEKVFNSPESSMVDVDNAVREILAAKNQEELEKVFNKPEYIKFKKVEKFNLAASEMMSKFLADDADKAIK